MIIGIRVPEQELRIPGTTIFRKSQSPEKLLAGAKAQEKLFGRAETQKKLFVGVGLEP